MTAPVEDVVEPQPLPELATWLTLRHQEEQQQIADKTAAGLALLWSVLRFDRLDETTPAWLHAASLQIEEKFRESERAAFNFVQGTKWAIKPLSKPLREVRTVFPTSDVQVALRATGPASIKRATSMAIAAPVRDPQALTVDAPQLVPRMDLSSLVDDLMAAGKLNSTGAGVKFALNGGRGEVQQLVAQDAKTETEIGWARVTEDSATGPCYFCALLASQGAVFYNADSFKRSNDLIRDPVKGARGNNRTTRRAFVGDGVAKVHDHCKCSLRPVYRQADSLDERARFFLRQWNRFQGSGSPDEKMKNFRKSYVQPPPYQIVLPDLLKVVRNRDLLAARLGEGSSQVRWYDRLIEENFVSAR